MELCLYNAVFTAMSVDCKNFTYVNQLASSEQDLSERFGWFQCACCPPNVLRLLGSIGGYVWNISSNSKTDVTQIDVHLYAPATLYFETSSGKATLKQECDWPRDGSIKLSLSGKTKTVQLKLRIPGWATSWNVRITIYVSGLFIDRNLDQSGSALS